MANKEVPFFLRSIANADAKLYALVDETLDLVHCEGALEPKYKHLISMVADAICNHPSGAAACAKEAIDAGATKEQAIEAMRIVYSAAGLPMVLENIGVYKAIEEA
ncbi:MAG: carboxymuconolactone decarboxylase family protein [Clostridia bacterium]